MFAAEETASILYGDGSLVEMEYDALRRLIQVRDWLGETCMERDTVGRPERIRNHAGRATAYEWGVMDERRSMTYPDGRKVSCHYDEKFRFSDMEIRTPEGAAETIHYSYDGFGRLIRKEMPGGLATLWQYNEKGQPEKLIHTDRKGVVDRYSYEYDLTGNKTAIRKERRGLEEESGSYAYTYDLLGRLEGVSKDGAMLRSYAYDAFGNRKEMRQYLPEVSSDSIGTFADSESSAVCTRYTYDALDRLLTAREAGSSLREYRYDRRGNLTEERINGELAHSYSYGAMNRLCRATNGQGAEALYRYNGLGQRTSRTIGGVEERYLLDLTRPYHNLLGITSGGKEQTFYWDGNVAAMEEMVRGTFHYYLQDELGSPLRVNGYEGRTENGYLSYGYDEFGEDVYGEYGEPYTDLDREGIPNPYSRQGEEQPFGYTGYRKDEVSGTYFAQAREYLPETGRFMAEDMVRGNGAVPVTLNRYGYCWGNPIKYCDQDGRLPIEYFVPIVAPAAPGIIAMDATKKYLKNAAESYKRQRQEIPAPEMPTDPTGLPDYTEVIDEWLYEKEKNFQDLKEGVNDGSFLGGIPFYILGNLGLTGYFISQVMPKGEMDIKVEENWTKAFGGAKPDYFIYRGEIMDASTLGNITFGYAGAALYSDDMLYMGGGVVNMLCWDWRYTLASPFLPYFGDAPEDYEAVKKGIDTWKEEHGCD